MIRKQEEDYTEQVRAEVQPITLSCSFLDLDYLVKTASLGMRILVFANIAVAPSFCGCNRNVVVECDTLCRAYQATVHSCLCWASDFVSTTTDSCCAGGCCIADCS